MSLVFILRIRQKLNGTDMEARLIAPHMKPALLAVAFLLLALPSFSQGMYGFTAGIGKGTISKSYTTPAFSVYCLAKLSRTFYLGGAISYERYSFNHNFGTTNATFGDVININQKSPYTFCTPVLDVGI